MITLKSLVSKGIMLAVLTCAQVSHADSFTSADVLKWNAAEQNSYFSTSIGMIGIVSTQTGKHDDIAACLNAWYWKDGSVNPASNERIRTVMTELPDYHPQALILAVVEKECGDFERS